MIKFILGCFLLIILLSIASCAVCCGPYMEARSFNKFQPEGAPKATMWDAMFIELRVDPSSKVEKGHADGE